MNLDVVMNRNFTGVSDKYISFCKEKDSCKKCSLYSDHKQVIQSEGNALNPIFFFVGEAPGKEETEQFRPFIGRAGQRLRQELRKHKAFTRNNTLISNVLACRPLNNVFPKDGSNSREYFVGSKKCKSRELVSFCSNNWLMKEISIVQPKVIVTLGSQSLEYVRGDRGITLNRGSWKFLPAFKAWSLATYHPSYVIRCANDKEKEYICEQFSQDIAKIANSWRNIVEEDPRMHMNELEWNKQKHLESIIQKGLLKPSPIND